MSMITEKAIETLEIEAGAVEALKGRIGEIEAGAVEALKGRIGAEFEAAVQCILDCTARVVVTGMGKSGHIGRKIAATLALNTGPGLVGVAALLDP